MTKLREDPSAAKPSSRALRAIDLRLIEDLFGMGGGYVLSFTNATFAEFFQDELGINIDDPRYSAEGGSKAKRLRCFLRCSNLDVQVRTLQALWEYREAERRRQAAVERYPNAAQEFKALLTRLGGKGQAPMQSASLSPESTQMDAAASQSLKERLLKVTQLQPQPRGYAFEGFLKDLFDASGLKGRASFRLVGEQIDGSFELSGEIYLLEAKWQDPPVAVADLRSFNAKVEEKAAWSRGLFVSISGFTEDGLTAFGRGKRLVCMDGLDLHEVLAQSLPFQEVVAKKVRRAAETGAPFVRVRDLYV